MNPVDPHTPSGYRALSANELDLINRFKAIENDIGTFLQEVETTHPIDLRWLSIGRTHLQQGFMALTRAVAKPISTL